MSCTISFNTNNIVITINSTGKEYTSCNSNSVSGNFLLSLPSGNNYGINVDNGRIKLALSQNYEFTNNSNYHKEQGNNNNLSDLHGNAGYTNDNMNIGYNFMLKNVI